MKVSIKAKLTLWYVICFALSVILMLVLTSSVRIIQTENTLTEMLTGIIDDAVWEAEESDSLVDAYDEDTPYLRDNILISVYDISEEQVGGYSPGALEDDEFIDGETRKVQLSGEDWIIYDRTAHIEGYGDIWIKGCVSVTNALSETQSFLQTELIIFPIIIAVALIGGILIARRAFKPIRVITNTANDIASGKDLSKRIPLQKQKDEISSLVNTFNSMFARLEKAFESEKRFSDDVSHELKTPLAVIINTAEFAIEDDAEEKDESLRIIKKQAEEMSALVNKLLMLARAENGKIKPSKEVFNLSELCLMIAEQIQENAAKKRMRVNCDIEDDVSINADEMMVMSMIMNIAENAVKYGREDGNITIAVKKEKDGAYVSVCDDGPGINEENLDKIWQRFFREEESRTTKGTGLGLPIAKWIAEMHGGDIEVSSEKDIKTIFKIFLPF